MSGGGSQPDSSNYPTYLQTFHELLIDGAGATTPNFNLADLMNDASTGGGGNVYALVDPFDPESVITGVNTRRDAFGTIVDAMAPQTDIEGFLDAAIAKYDGSLVGTTEINAVVTAAEARSLPEFQRNVSGLLDGAFTIGAMVNIQLAPALMMAAQQRMAESGDLEAKLHLFAQRDRTQAVLGIMDAMSRMNLTKIASTAQAAGLFYDMGRFEIAANDDQIRAALGYREAEQLWDFKVVTEAIPGYQMIFGAPSMPRALTKGERVVGMLGTSLNAGIQGGVAFGSPAAGAFMGIASLGINLLGGLIDGN